MSIAASHSSEFSLLHVDVSRAFFYAKAQRPLPVKLPVGDCSGKKIGMLKKSMYGTRDAAFNCERASGKFGLRAGAQFKKSVSQQEEDLGFDTRRRFYGDRIEGESVGA